ncbi:MAG: hypothetical protein ACRDK8_02125 [Solirubrobacteraceae bacterium]
MSSPDRDGRHDFDFLFGRWRVANRRLGSPLTPGSTDWVQFSSTVQTEPVLAGLGNVDRYRSPEFPGRPGWEALALRLFDPDTRTWRIWWASTAAAGELDTPVTGCFAGDHGVFGCDDVLVGRPLKMRYEWSEVNSPEPRWQQAFSFDGGRSWQPNWVMVWRRD